MRNLRRKYRTGRRSRRRSQRDEDNSMSLSSLILFFSFIALLIVCNVFTLSGSVKKVLWLSFISLAEAKCIIAFCGNVRISGPIIGLWVAFAVACINFERLWIEGGWVLISLAPILVFGLCFVGLILIISTIAGSYFTYLTLSFMISVLFTIVGLLLCAILYACSFKRLVIRLPRYRRLDPFARSKLCTSCRGVLQKSSLLFGTWRMITWVEEWHPLDKTTEEMQQLWRICNLCEILLSQRAESEGQLVAANSSSTANYGTISSAHATKSLCGLESGSIKIKIRLRDSGSFMDCLGSRFTVELYTDSDIKYNELLISEGKCEHLIKPIFYIFKRANEAFTGDIIDRPNVQASTGSETNMCKIQDWIKACSRHEACKSRNSGEIFLPTRLVYVGTVQSPKLRLMEPTDLTDQNTKYIALSHYW